MFVFKYFLTRTTKCRLECSRGSFLLAGNCAPSWTSSSPPTNSRPTLHQASGFLALLYSFHTVFSFYIMYLLDMFQLNYRSHPRFAIVEESDLFYWITRMSVGKYLLHQWTFRTRKTHIATGVCAIWTFAHQNSSMYIWLNITYPNTDVSSLTN